MKSNRLISNVYNKKVIEFIFGNIRHSFIWRRLTRKLVRPSPYERVPNIFCFKVRNRTKSRIDSNYLCDHIAQKKKKKKKSRRNGKQYKS